MIIFNKYKIVAATKNYQLKSGDIILQGVPAILNDNNYPQYIYTKITKINKNTATLLNFRFDGSGNKKLDENIYFFSLPMKHLFSLIKEINKTEDDTGMDFL